MFPETCDTVLRKLGLSLPTEAQWEYACRAGTQTPWWPSRNPEDLAWSGNVSDQSTRRGSPQDRGSWNDGFSGLAEVGQLAANPFGLHDVHGNLVEWCLDERGSYSEPARDGDGSRLRSGLLPRVIRGGAFFRSAYIARSAIRLHADPRARDSYLGVRPVLILKSAVKGARHARAPR